MILAIGFFFSFLILSVVSPWLGIFMFFISGILMMIAFSRRSEHETRKHRPRQSQIRKREPIPPVTVKRIEHDPKLEQMHGKINALEQQILYLKSELQKRDEIITELENKIKRQQQRNINSELLSELEENKQLLATLEERYNRNEIPGEVYVRLKSKYESKIAELEKKLDRVNNE